MARKVVSRKQKREEAEAAEAAEASAPKKKKKKKAKRAKKKEAAQIRMKVFWGVFNHAMKRVAKYEFNQKKAAIKRASELNVEGKPPHFVAKIKEEVEE